MKPSRGDLIFVSDGEVTSTCIVLTEEFNISADSDRSFYYTICIETGLYGIVYDHEITSIVCESFAPNFEFRSDLFETDYSHYSELYESFAYFPTFWHPLEISDDDDDSSED